MWRDVGGSVRKVANAVESLTFLGAGRMTLRVQQRGIHGHYVSGVVIAFGYIFRGRRSRGR